MKRSKGCQESNTDKINQEVNFPFLCLHLNYTRRGDAAERVQLLHYVLIWSHSKSTSFKVCKLLDCFIIYGSKAQSFF